MFNRKSVKRAAAAALTAVMIFSQSSVVMADTASNHAADGTDAYAAAATTISGTAVKEDSTASDAAGAEKTAGAGTSTAEAGASENATTGAGMQATATGAGTSTDTATTAGAGTSTDTATTAGADTSMDTASTAGSLTHADNSTGAATTAAIEESAEAADTEDIAVPEGATDDKTGAALDGTLTFENDAIRVKADFTKDAEIPEGAELSVSMIGDDDEAYDSYKKIAEDKVSGVLDYLKLYDISIVKDGGEIEPKAPVTVSIEHTDGASLPEDETIEILHMTEDGSAETLEASASMSSAPVMRRAAARNAVSAPAVTAATATARSARKTYSGATFKTGSFSVFAEAGSLKTVVVTAEGENYTAAVTFGKDAGIPAGAVLTAKELTGDAGDEYRQKAAEALGEQEITQARFFDIHFTVDGKEQEPAPGASVQVRLAFSDSMEVGKSGEVKAVHFKEGADGVTPEILDTETSALSSGQNNTAAATDSDAGEEMTAFDVVDFTQGSFSVTGVVVTSGELTNNGWPTKNGQYVMLLSYPQKDGSSASTNTGYNYYAVKNDGTLMQVSVENGKAVFPSDIKNVDDIKQYIWTSDKTQGTLSNTTDNQTVYINPANENGVSNTEEKLVIENKRIRTYSSYRYTDRWGYYRSGYCYLAVTRDNKETVIAYSFDRDYAAQVTFLKSFTVDDTKPGQGSGNDQTLDPPATKKELTDNGDGTYDLSLSVKGQSKSNSESTKADVLIVFDTSGSMGDYVTTTSGKRIRLAIAKDTLKNLASKLLSQNSGEHPDRIMLSLITFGSSATEATGWTSDKNTFDDYIDKAKAEGGTNWEAALYKANTVEHREDAEKYVIFISDGEPTFYRGTENEEYNHNNDLSYWFAKDDAYRLVQNGNNFYTISVFEPDSVAGSRYMERLTRYAYSGTDASDAKYPDGRCQSAEDQPAIEKAFANIIDEITHNLGYQSVTINDELTSMTSSVFVNGQAGSFRYEVTDGNGMKVVLTPNQDGSLSYTIDGKTKKFRGAEYTDGKVTWNMDPGANNPFVLDNGYTYKTIFTVWPSQEAYDLVAKLKNGTIQYSELINDQKEQINEKKDDSGNTEYVLKTNTNAEIEYSTISTTIINGTEKKEVKKQEPETITNPEGIQINVPSINIQKKWDDNQNESFRPTKVQFKLVQDKDTGNAFELISNGELSSVNEWKSTCYVSPGLIGPKNEVLEEGHTYDIVEVDTDQHYELSTETYHPMLVKKDNVVKIYNYVNGNLSELPNSEFAAENKLKGSLSLEKKVFNANGDKDITIKDGKVNPAIADETFSYQVTLVAPRERIADDFKYQLVKQDGTGAVSQTLQNVDGTISEYSLQSTGTGDYAKTTVQFTVTLKPGEKLELPFLPLDTKYIITEDQKSGYTLKDIKVEGETVSNLTNDDAKGTIDANQTDAVVFSNKFSSAFNLKLLKTNDSTESAQKLAGAEFTLKKVNGETATEAVNIEGTVVGTENNPIKSGTNAVSIGDLPSGKYRLTETKAPDGYTKMENPVEFTVVRAMAGEKDAVTIITETNSVATVKYTSDPKTDYTITIQNKAIYVLPHSGGNGVVPYMVAGVVLMLVAAGVLGTGGVLRKGGGSY